MEKMPLLSVTAPVFVPFTVTLTPGSGAPLASFTVPVTVLDWAKRTVLLSWTINRKEKHNRYFQERKYWSPEKVSTLIQQSFFYS